MNLILHGYTGRMGRIVGERAAQGFAGASLAASVSPECANDGVDNCYVSMDHYTGPAD